MIRKLVTLLWVLVLSCLLIPVCFAQQEGASSTPNIEPEAEKLIRQMSERIKEAKHFRFQTIDTIDEVLETGQKLQFSHTRSGTISRPNKLRIDTMGDITNKSVWKDEKTFTLLDKDHNLYGQIDATGTIDETIDMLMERYGVSMPMADLLSGNPYKVLLSRVKTGEYVGLHNVGKIKCHHLAFTQEDVDWQVWIDAGDKPALRKMVITYKQLPGEPQYCVTLQSVEHLAEAPPQEVFQFKAPEGAEKIEFLPIKGKEIGAAAKAR